MADTFYAQSMISLIPVFNHISKCLDFGEESLGNDLVIPNHWNKAVSSV